MADPRLPPSQYVARGWPVMHYGRVPRLRPETWDFRVFGATAGAEDYCFTFDSFALLEQTTVVADFHCVTKFSVLDNRWEGVAASTLLATVPPSPDATHAMVWGEYGYSANLSLADLAEPGAIFAMSRNGEPLSPDHGAPLRLVVPHLYAWKSVKWARSVEYLTDDRRGFWEERGYHNTADPWRDQRYSYQESPGEGPDQRLRE